MSLHLRRAAMAAVSVLALSTTAAMADPPPWRRTRWPARCCGAAGSGDAACRAGHAPHSAPPRMAAPAAAYGGSRAWRLLRRAWPHRAWPRPISQRRRGTWPMPHGGGPRFSAGHAAPHRAVPDIARERGRPERGRFASGGQAPWRRRECSGARAQPECRSARTQPACRRTAQCARKSRHMRWRARNRSRRQHRRAARACCPPATRRSAGLVRAPMRAAPSKAGWSNAARRSSEIRSSPISAWRAGAAEAASDGHSEAASAIGAVRSRRDRRHPPSPRRHRAGIRRPAVLALCL